MGADKKKEYYTYCKDAFVMEKLSFEAIAERYPVSVQTLSKWQYLEVPDWRTQRKEYLSSKKNAAEVLKKAIEDKIIEIGEDGISPQRAKELELLTRTLDKLEKREDILQITITVMGYFTGFLKESYPEKLDDVGKIIRDFFVYIEGKK